MSGASGLAPQILRGLQLQELGRYAEAEKAFREALSQQPDDAFALHHLAACQFHLPDRRRAAMETIGQAIALEPNAASHHVLRAFILCLLDRGKEAMAAAQTARELDPTLPSAWSAEAQALLQAGRWAEAERAARQALELDADYVVAANQLAQALRMQNKMAESAGHLAGMLARDPEDPYTHANAGWDALQRGKHRVAEDHFREALRLHPGFASAREGLLNSFRARSPLYRAHLRYTFFMQRLGVRTRWAVVIGFYLAARLGAVAGRGAGVALAIYFLFVLWVWVARPVGNLLLLTDNFARQVLNRAERLEAEIVGGGLLVGVLAGSLGFAFGSELAMTAGIALIAQSFPLSMCFTNPSPAGRVIFGAVGAVTFLGLILVLLSGMGVAVSATLGAEVLGAGCIGCIASTWLGNIPYLRQARP